MKVASVAILFIALALTGIGCGSSKSECQTTVKHLFDVGCDGSYPTTSTGLSEQEVVDICTAENKAVNGGSNPCHCKDQFDAMLSCFDTVTAANCDVCSSQISVYNTCVASDSNC